MSFSKSRFLISSLCLLFLLSLVKSQDSLRQQQQQRTSLIISQNGNGQIRVVDPSTNSSRVINTSELDNQTAEEEGDLDEQVVRGLWEWLEEKKRKKKDKNRRPKPLVQPKIERKEIHIHINNTIKKKDDHHKKKKKHHGDYHYESYHDAGHHYDYHDKHYHGKHSWPLLGHHYYGSDHDYHGHYGAGQHHYGGHDDYSGYESQKVISKAPSRDNSSNIITPAGSSSKSVKKSKRANNGGKQLL